MTSTITKNQHSFPEELPDITTTKSTSDILTEVYSYFDKHCVMSHHEKVAIALWIASSYAIDSFRIYPKLTLISPQKRCGKSTTMEVIEAIVRNGLLTSNLTPATIFRVTQRTMPTLLIDEADTFVKNGEPAMIGIINSGHTKSSANIIRCCGDNHEAKVFSTWMPMVLASIGALSTTIMDRSVIINLRRKKSTERTLALPTNLKATCYDLRCHINALMKAHIDHIEQNIITPPSLSNDRATDNWTPLFTIANLACSQWKDWCEEAYRALNEPSEAEESTLLLQDIKATFEEKNSPRLSTADLISSLGTIEESPWATYNHCRSPITPQQLSQVLKPFNIKPKNMRFGETTKRGYELEMFEDAFDRYL